MIQDQHPCIINTSRAPVWRGDALLFACTHTHARIQAHSLTHSLSQSVSHLATRMGVPKFVNVIVKARRLLRSPGCKLLMAVACPPCCWCIVGDVDFDLTWTEL
jgi:hypothetical protein